MACARCDADPSCEECAIQRECEEGMMLALVDYERENARSTRYRAHAGRSSERRGVAVFTLAKTL
jgi:hypothetical protein